jgi:hypothetical protein
MVARKFSYYNEEAYFLSVFSKKETPENFWKCPIPKAFGRHF